VWECDIVKSTSLFNEFTIIAQKALSAIIRLQESEPLAVVSISQEVPKTYYI
jgi:ATP-dependent DNA helicase RecQ